MNAVFILGKEKVVNGLQIVSIEVVACKPYYYLFANMIHQEEPILMQRFCTRNAAEACLAEMMQQLESSSSSSRLCIYVDRQQPIGPEQKQ